MSEPNDYFFLRFNHPLFDGILKTATPTVAKEILECDKDLLANSVYPLLYTVWPLKIDIKI